MSFATSHLATCAGELYKSKDATGDFTLTCQGKVIKAHSFILSMGSEYFKTALNTAVGDNSKTMEVKEFSYEVLSTAVDFMYGIEIPEDFNNRDELKNLLHMADQYLMGDLKNAVSFRIGKDLNVENIFDTSHLAEQFGAVALSEKCAEFIFENAAAIEDEKLAEMKEGVVMASLVQKFFKESKRNSWMTKLFGKRADFKRREHFGPEEDYKGYVMSRIKPKMFVSLNTSGNWQHSSGRYKVDKGSVGFVVNTSSASVTVKWLTGSLTDFEGEGPSENLDLLTSPVTFSC